MDVVKVALNVCAHDEVQPPVARLADCFPCLVSRSSSDRIHSGLPGSPPRRSARLRSSPPSAPLDPAPSVSPTAVASHLLSVCPDASPVKVDIGLHPAPLGYPSKTFPRLVVRSPVSVYPSRAAIAAHSLPCFPPNVTSVDPVVPCMVSYSAWRTHIACVGVVVLFHGGCWSFLTCPRTYLLTSSIKAGPLPSSALSCTPSSVLRTLGLPPGSARFQPSGLILAVLVRLDCPVGSLLFRIVLSQRATA